MIFKQDHIAMAEVNTKSKVNTGLAAAPLAGHHGMPPRQRIYMEVRQKQASELTQEKSTSLGNHHQVNKLLLGDKTKLEKKLPVERHKYRRVPYSPHPQPLPCISHHSPPDSSLALFYITDSSEKPNSSNVLQWLPGSPCCRRLF